jgi:hypothetical protein
MKQASIDSSMKGKNLEFINQRLKEAFQDYYRLKGSHKKLDTLHWNNELKLLPTKETYRKRKY